MPQNEDKGNKRGEEPSIPNSVTGPIGLFTEFGMLQCQADQSPSWTMLEPRLSYPSESMAVNP
jgi:hypothetical protein